jgi:DNA-binding transcriptional MerR regulator
MSVLNTQEVAEKLKCNARKVHYLMEKGLLKPIKRYDRFFIFDEKEIIRFINQSKSLGNGKK